MKGIRLQYSYKLKRSVPLLSEEYWLDIKKLLDNRAFWIGTYRREQECSLVEAIKNEPIGQAALDHYETLTGVRLSHPDELWAVQMSQYGSPCVECGKPFRTPRAKLCAECGYRLPEGMVAGALKAADH